MLCFIWGNSLLSKEISGAISHFFADFMSGDGTVGEEGHYLVRKAAHLTEFAILGAVFLLLSGEYTKDSAKRALSSIIVGVCVPLIDETIQIFSNRGSALSDVWIDALGYAIGTLLTATVIFLVARKRNRENSS